MLGNAKPATQLHISVHMYTQRTNIWRKQLFRYASKSQ